jgi:hypothetical protein
VLRSERSRIELAVWLTLAAVLAIYMAHDTVGLAGGAHDLFDRWVNAALLWIAAVICFVGALRTVRGRTAWVFAALGLASWAIGDTIWTVRFEDAAGGPLTSVSDAFWLAWYPLMVVGLALLVRDRVPAFELHRWIDGLVVMLVVATPWVALFLEPVAEESEHSALAEAVSFAYPLGDVMLVGSALGVCALLAWRPGRMWLLLGLGLTLMGVSDAIYSVEAVAAHYSQEGVYDAGWAAGALMIAWAAWQPHPGRVEPREATGWPAIALPISAQALAIAIQIYGYFHELPRSERILTIVVLLIAIVQTVLTMPPPRRETQGG